MKRPMNHSMALAALISILASAVSACDDQDPPIDQDPPVDECDTDECPDDGREGLG